MRLKNVGSRSVYVVSGDTTVEVAPGDYYETYEGTCTIENKNGTDALVKPVEFI